MGAKNSIIHKWLGIMLCGKDPNVPAFVYETLIHPCFMQNTMYPLRKLCVRCKTLYGQNSVMSYQLNYAKLRLKFILLTTSWGVYSNDQHNFVETTILKLSKCNLGLSIYIVDIIQQHLLHWWSPSPPDRKYRNNTNWNQVSIVILELKATGEWWLESNCSHKENWKSVLQNGEIDKQI